MEITKFYSKNFDKKKRTRKNITTIILHYTGMQSERESIIRLCNTKSKVSTHFLINQNGKVYRMVQDNRVAWHAGKSCWGNYKNLNKYSIGIELVNKGHRFDYTNFTKKQIFSLVQVCKKIIKRYKIKKKNIVGHSDIAPIRKIDPGEKFPWKQLAKRKIGIWHNLKPNFLKNFRKAKILTKQDKEKFAKNLNSIGYCFSNNKKSFISKTVKAFQRHYRQELINGLIDKECLIIAENLQKKL